MLLLACGQAQLAEARQQADAVEAARAAAADAAARLGAGPRRDVGAQAPQDGGAASPDHSRRPMTQGALASPRRDIGALLEEMEALRARLQARVLPLLQDYRDLGIRDLKP